MRKAIQLITPVIFAGMLAMPAFAQAPTPAPGQATPGPRHGGGHGVPDHIKRLREGKHHLEHCHRILDAQAGTEYGGHRAKADQLVQQAIAELKAAEDYWRQNERGK